MSSRFIRYAAFAALTALGASPALHAQDDGGVRVFTFGRPRIGVTVATSADQENDKLGARIRDVTPDGPADKAGLKSGDIITKFNGVSLGGAKAEDDDDSGPGQKLIELAQKLEPGDTVALEYRRDGNTRSVKLVAQDLHGGMRTFSFNGPGGRNFTFQGPGDGPGMELPRMMLRGPEGMGGMPGQMRFMFGEPGFGDGVELAELNDDLGDYFGTRTGVLVLKAPRDSTLPLRAGDVILSIDGRAPKSVDQVSRILRSYDGGEAVKLELMRKQKKTTVTWTVPAERTKERMRWRSPQHTPPPASERS